MSAWYTCVGPSCLCMWHWAREGGAWEGGGGRRGALDALRLALARPFEVPRTHAMRRGEEVRVEYARVWDCVYSSFRVRIYRIRRASAESRCEAAAVCLPPTCTRYHRARPSPNTDAGRTTVSFESAHRHASCAAVSRLGHVPAAPGVEHGAPVRGANEPVWPGSALGLSLCTPTLGLRCARLAAMSAIAQKSVSDSGHHAARRDRPAAWVPAPPCGASAVRESRFAHTLREMGLVSLDANNAAHAGRPRRCLRSARQPSLFTSRPPFPPSSSLSLFSRRNKRISEDQYCLLFFRHRERAAEGQARWASLLATRTSSPPGERRRSRISLSLSASLCVRVLFCLFRPRSVCHQSCGVGPPPTRTRGPGQARGCGSAVAVNAGGQDAALAGGGPSCVPTVAGSPAGHARARLSRRRKRAAARALRGRAARANGREGRRWLSPARGFVMGTQAVWHR